MKTLIDDAVALSSRCRETEDFRAYLQVRQTPILAVGAAILVVALGGAAGIAMCLAGLRTWLTLPGLLLGSLAAVVSAMLQLYVFFSWLEGRALAHALHKPLYMRHGIPIGPMPPVPWAAVAAVVLAPLLLLALSAPVAAILVILLGAATPVAFAHFESQLPRHPAPDDAET